MNARRYPGRLVLMLACVPLAMLAFSLAARWCTAADLVAVFAVPIAACLLAACLALALLRRWWPAAWLLLPTAFACIRVAPLWLASVAGPVDGVGLRMLAINLLRDNADHDSVLAAVRSRAPDLVVFSEATPAWERALAPLRADYPFGDGWWDPGFFGIAVWSRLPLRDLRIVPLGYDWAPAITAVLDTAAGDVGVAAIHPPRPGLGRRTAERDAALAALPSLLARLPSHRIVLGDGNATRWNPAFADLLATTGLRDTCDGAGWQGSWPSTVPWFLRIPIDHVLVSAGIGVRRREVGPFVGSDHLPVYAELVLPGAAPGGR